MSQIKMGSLFSGSGGFELAGMMHGVEPVWASEIEPFCIKVTRLRFPRMKHLGSVTDVRGDSIEPVDIITFGSPCQDLSQAGMRAGLRNGERSHLFFEAIRIIKEMRDATDGKYPRFAVWENVRGAFSSGNGQDFREVLQSFADIVQRPAISIPLPAGGKWYSAGSIVGNGWSLAWRLYDAQYWGVPQRRKRIYLIADFGSERASEILFESNSVSGDSQPSGEKRETTPADSEGSVGRSSGHIYEPASLREENWHECDVTNALRANASKSSHAVLFENHSQDSRYTGPLTVSQTISAKFGTGGNNTPFVVEKSESVCAVTNCGYLRGDEDAER